MRALLRVVAVAAILTWQGISVNSAAAQDFSDRWSIIPKAHAEPAPEAPNQTKQNSPDQPAIAKQPTESPANHLAPRSANRIFSGKASFYSYAKGKTASGATFNRDAMTAAHRSLPFGTRVRVTDPVSTKSVVVRIVDRGPWIRDRVLDLSLGAARTLGITDRVWPKCALKSFSSCPEFRWASRCRCCRPFLDMPRRDSNYLVRIPASRNISLQEPDCEIASGGAGYQP